MLERVRPRPEDRSRQKEICDALLARIEHLAAERGLLLRPMLVGSAARGTWLAGDHDLDIFLGVPESGSLEPALDLARIAAPEHEEKYAEHAYVHALVDSFEVDLVPCYLVPDASRLRSAVDRTPFHTDYIASRIAGLEDAVLLLKQFMKGTGVYGSELKVGGFSGYLAELLVLRYGSFAAVLQAASSWKPGEIIDLESHAAGPQAAPLVVVDPVDPGRNVAAALTMDRMFQFAAASRCFLGNPGLEFFFPPTCKPLSDEELRAQIEARGSCLILIDFQAPAVVEDVLFPQLRKAEESINALLDRNGFRLLRSDVGRYSDRAAILLEMEVWELSGASRRTGPPVWEAEHLSRFLAAHPHTLSGPYIAKGKAVVELPRQHTRAQDLLAAEIGSLSLGRHLSPAVRAEHKIYVGPEMAEIEDKGFRVFLAEYFRSRVWIC